MDKNLVALFVLALLMATALVMIFMVRRNSRQEDERLKIPSTPVSPRPPALPSKPMPVSELPAELFGTVPVGVSAKGTTVIETVKAKPATKKVPAKKTSAKKSTTKSTPAKKTVVKANAKGTKPKRGRTS